MTYKIRLKHYKLDIDVIFIYAFFAVTLYMCLLQYNTTTLMVQGFVLAVGALRGYAVSVRQKFIFPIGLGIFFSLNWLFCFVMRSFFQPTHTGYLRCIAYTVCYIGLAVLLLKTRIGVWGSGILLLVCAGIIIVRMLLGVDINDIVLTGSRNYISIILLFCILLYYLALYQSGKRGVVLVLLPAIIFFAICMVAFGRGGIITSGFFLCMLCVYEILNVIKKRAAKRFWMFLLVVVVLLVLYMFLSPRITFTLGNFSSGLVSVSRLEIWSTFFKNDTNSVVDFLCGADPIVTGYSGNLHNSFIQCYAWYGLIAFCGLIVLSVKAIIDGIKKRDLFWTILILTLFIRAFTDMVFYTRYCELFLCFFLMYWRYQKKISFEHMQDIAKGIEDNS